MKAPDNKTRANKSPRSAGLLPHHIDHEPTATLPSNAEGSEPTFAPRKPRHEEPRKPRLTFTQHKNPRTQSQEGQKLFPDADEGNLRRLLRFVFRQRQWEDITPSTRVWVVLALLIDYSIAEDNMRNFSRFARYVEKLMNITLEYDHRKVQRYWRKYYPHCWNNRRDAGEPPQNAQHTHDFADFLCQCFLRDGKVDRRLLA